MRLKISVVHIVWLSRSWHSYNSLWYSMCFELFNTLWRVNRSHYRWINFLLFATLERVFCHSIALNSSNDVFAVVQVAMNITRVHATISSFSLSIRLYRRWPDFDFEFFRFLFFFDCPCCANNWLFVHFQQQIFHEFWRSATKNGTKSSIRTATNVKNELKKKENENESKMKLKRALKRLRDKRAFLGFFGFTLYTFFVARERAFAVIIGIIVKTRAQNDFGQIGFSARMDTNKSRLCDFCLASHTQMRKIVIVAVRQTND